ncbi:MAG: hypothetical protein LBB31_02960 [Prevotellaceae bacterium]|jgi:hypothetical protein|nr:hypothetical protein [Prevotellaceae bacterium]
MYAKKRMVKIFDFIIIATAISLLSVMVLNSCSDDIKNTITYTVNEPVYMPLAEFRTPPPVKPAQEVVNPGKICLYGNYIFINEINKGFHVIDNTNPASPRPVAFVDLPGNIDITVKDNLLFADSFIDLVWFDIAQPAQLQATGRLQEAFPNVLPPIDNKYPVKEIDNSKGVVVGWEVKTITEEEQRNSYIPYPWKNCPTCYYLDKAAYANSEGISGGGVSGVTTLTGSTARFAAYGDYLYVVTSSMLKVFALSGNTVTKGSEQYLNWNTETIFAYGQKLFLGTTTGLLIYDITNPAAPARLSSLSHVMGCDPVVVQGNYAYVTIRGGNACGQELSLLDVVDISNPSTPYLKVSFDMNSPYGLGIDGHTLFVCDNGLKVFDASDPLQIGARQVKHFTGINGFDVIPYNNILLLIGSDGLYQYDYSDIRDIKQISVLKVTTK